MIRDSLVPVDRQETKETLFHTEVEQMKRFLSDEKTENVRLKKVRK